MEQQYSDIQKAALVSLLIEMVNADRRIDLEEVRVLNHICRELNIDSDTFTCGRGLIYKAAIVIASRMSEEKKIHAAKALVRIIRSACAYAAEAAMLLMAYSELLSRYLRM